MEMNYFLLIIYYLKKSGQNAILNSSVDICTLHSNIIFYAHLRIPYIGTRPTKYLLVVRDREYLPHPRDT